MGVGVRFWARRWGAVLTASGLLLLGQACGDDDDTAGEGEGEGEGECGPRGATCDADAPACVPAQGGCCSCADACMSWDCAVPENNSIACPATGAVGSPCGDDAECEYCIEGSAARFACTGGSLTPLSVCAGD